ncbi:MAG: class I SAM-dependent methyltransferase, partial [Planctomycetota bacterium]|nr:class I SAM-dependent methyltransferase [Planctomycetota bacterium]
MKAALGSLDACAAESFQKFLFFPRSYDAFNVEFERIGAAMIDKPEAYAKAIRRLYRWKLHERLGNLYSRREEWDKADAAYRKAVEATQVGTTRFQHALALLKLGQNESASVALEGALEHEPFLFEAREHQARLLFEAADFEVCRACCQEALHIIRGCPIYEPKAAPFQELLFRCQNRGTDLTDTAQPRQYRILTFNWHEPFLSSVCKTGHYFDIVGVGAMGRTTIDGIQTWNTGKREFPANATLLVEFEEVQKHIQQGVYDLALCFTSFDLAFLKQADMPKIFCPLSSPMNDLGDQYEDSSVREGYLQSIKKLTSKVLITYITDLMGREDCGGYGLPGTVVSKGPPVDPANYDGYTGKTPAVLRVGNLIAERWFLNYGIQQRVLEGIPHQILGTNPSIPGARCSESREDLLDHLRRYRLFFHSFDKRMMEGHASTSLIEAMMTGMPVVSTEHPLSIIVDGVHGFVTDDIPTLRKRIQELLEDREMAIELGRNAQALAIEYFGIQNFIRKMNEAFAKCIRCNSIPLGIDGSPPSSQSEKRHAEAGNSIRPFSPNNWEQFELRPVPGTEFSEINGIIGFMVPGDVQFLMVKAATLPHGGTIVEIGSFMGLSSVLMAQTLMRTGNHQARIYSVDTWEGSPEHQGLEIIKNRQLFDIFKDNIQKAGISSFIHPIRKSSTVAFEDFEDGSIDLLFVDGDHSFEGCYSDLIHWFPKLRPGGGLIGHDCEPDSGVRAAVKKFSSETGIPYTIHPLPKTHYMFEFDLTDHWDRQAKKSGLAVKDNTHIEPPDDRVTLSSIVWSAPFLEQGDDADDARSLTLGLENLGLPIKIDPVKLTGQSADLDEPLLQKLEQMHGVPLSSEGFVHVMHLAPPFYQKAPGAAVNIGRANFGADRLPIEWVPRCNEMDEIWVPSDFNIESFAFSGVDRERLHKIPLCFDAQKFGEHVPPVQMPKKLGFWFLAAIDWHTASGWDALLRAYMEEFSAEDDLSLMLQLMLPAGVTPQDAAEEIRSFLKDELRVSNP